ncbi:aromatic amino acid ammonia-lyase [Longimicrobium sp.]|jgi:phenylalanine ammonia-lyase|uniref:HAL/PAL/TAL family ammonia-lyase n=1 Tax=Longimicrobium sp. TaxID=2029185 RepID=UPI002F93EFB5
MNSSVSLPGAMSVAASPPMEPVIVRGGSLTIDVVARVARGGAPVRLTHEEKVLDAVRASAGYVMAAVEADEPIYGVTTGFGGMSNVVIRREDATALQNNLPWTHKTGAGRPLPLDDVRACMLLRANVLLHGVSGIRLELIERMLAFLNAGVTPRVHSLGSIGASGDLVPLGYLAGSLAGVDDSFRVDFRGEEMGAVAALERMGLPRLRLNPKEGLAIMNGTSAMSAIAANCVYDARLMLALTLGAHGLFCQGLMATNQSFHPFIHRHKPHAGQRWAAAEMLHLLAGSHLVRDEMRGQHDHRHQSLIQDRYSLRCLPQYLGPIVDGIARIGHEVEVEMNAVTDNPLVDVENAAIYHCGNFLGEHIGIAMDQLRYYMGLQAKHLDTQIALLVSPEFSHGLPASLVGNPDRKVNMGLKALQLTGNSIMPLLSFYGNSLADRFPTHAEQFNQNINSMGFGSANLTRQSLELFHQYMAVSLMFGVQAVDLRTHEARGHYDARACLSAPGARLYEAVREVVGRPPSARRPYVWNDDEQALDEHIARLAGDIARGGRLAEAVGDTLERLAAHAGRTPASGPALAGADAF